jgi:hypothetical protein
MIRQCRRLYLLIPVILLGPLLLLCPSVASGSRPFGRAVLANESGAGETLPVELSLQEGSSWGLPGGKIFLTVILTNRSSRAAGISIEFLGAGGTVTPGYILLEPGEARTQKLKIIPGGDGKSAPGITRLIIKNELPQTEVEPDIIEITARVLPLSKALGVWMDPYRQGLGYLALAAGAAVILFIAGGSLLFIFLIYPVARLQGSIYYRKKEDPESRERFDGRERSDAYILEEARAREISLADLEQNRCVMIFIGMPEKVESPALLFETKGIPYTITLSPAWQSRLIFILQGWLALFQRPHGAALRVECSRPGVVEIGGVIYSRVIIEPGEEFVSGGYRFQYSLPAPPVIKPNDGIDLLLEKGMNTWQRSR